MVQLQLLAMMFVQQPKNHDLFFHFLIDFIVFQDCQKTIAHKTTVR